VARTRKLSTPRPHAPAPGRTSHPTRDKLLNATRELLADHLPQALTADMVLQRSGISRGSLYHHFADFADLLEEALVQSFSSHVDRSIAMIAAALDAKSKKECFAAFSKVTARTQAVEMKAARFERARLIAFSEDNPRLAALLAREQQRLTDALTDLIREVQHRGWINKEFDPRAGAVLIQAYTLGKIVDDIVPAPMDPKAWNALIGRLVEKVFS
jgi:AcrR family transcriptional regulator